MRLTLHSGRTNAALATAWPFNARELGKLKSLTAVARGTNFLWILCLIATCSTVVIMVVLNQQTLACSLAVVCAVAASVFDVRERRIPNLLSGSFFVIGLALHCGLHGWGGIASSLLAAGIAGGLFLPFFLIGGMGAGDVKLMATVAAIVDLAPLQMVLLATVAAGAVCALALALLKARLQEMLRNVSAILAHHVRQGVQPHLYLNLANKETLRLPFAVPIAMGCIATLCVSAWKG